MIIYLTISLRYQICAEYTGISRNRDYVPNKLEFNIDAFHDPEFKRTDSETFHSGWQKNNFSPEGI